MRRTQLSAWVCGLAALGLAVGAAGAGPQDRPKGADDKEQPQARGKIVVTSPAVKDVVVTERYAARIHARRHTEIRALATGRLTEVAVKEGQAVKEGDVLFRVDPTLYRAKLDVELADVRLVELKLKHTKKLFEDKVVSVQEVELLQAELAKAQARAKLAEFELKLTTFVAPFGGVIDRIRLPVGSVVKIEDVLTVISDNSVLWVYSDMSEAQYLAFIKRQGPSADPSRIKLADSRIELVLADGSTFKHEASSNTVAIPAQFGDETKTIPFRADFPNPERLLRHGQTGTVRISRTLKDAVVIPQRATFELLDRLYVFVIDKDGVARQRAVTVAGEAGDLFVIARGLDPDDRIVLDGVRQIDDGDKVEYEYRKPDEAFANPKDRPKK